MTGFIDRNGKFYRCEHQRLIALFAGEAIKQAEKEIAEGNGEKKEV